MTSTISISGFGTPGAGDRDSGSPSGSTNTEVLAPLDEAALGSF